LIGEIAQDCMKSIYELMTAWNLKMAYWLCFICWTERADTVGLSFGSTQTKTDELSAYYKIIPIVISAQGNKSWVPASAACLHSVLCCTHALSLVHTDYMSTCQCRQNWWHVQNSRLKTIERSTRRRSPLTLHSVYNMVTWRMYKVDLSLNIKLNLFNFFLQVESYRFVGKRQSTYRSQFVEFYMSMVDM
jgi:hypothetical protein